MNLEPRAYQKAIFNSIMQKGNMLVVLPTGLGKTLIAFMLIEAKKNNGKCLFLAPTRPLVHQHLKSFLNSGICDESEVIIITGEINKKKRAVLYEHNIIFSTPQTIKNDLLNNIIPNPEKFALCIIDEAHRAIGNYAYTLIAAKLKDHTLIVGLTASPGGNRERINNILSNLFIQNVEIRTKTEDDVKPYVQNIESKWIETNLTPDLKAIKSELDSLCSELAKKLGAMGFPAPIKSKKLFLQMRQRILNINSNAKFPILLIYFMLLNVLHMQELVETQGASSLSAYITKMRTKPGKSAHALMNKPALSRIQTILSKTIEEHPKINLLIELATKMKDKKIIVFAQYRDQVKLIESKLNSAGFNARIFLGKKGQYTKKQQEETIADFRADLFKILVASSIGEEGLDIPAVDGVIFYEPVPSEIRSIQRRGRAGRFKEGFVYILMTKGTRDEYFYWASVNREKKMKRIISQIQNSSKQKPDPNTKDISSKSEPLDSSGIQIKPSKEGQTNLNDFF